MSRSFEEQLGLNKRQRKPVDREAKSPLVILGKGELGVADRQILTPLLKRFGVTLEYFTPEEYRERMRGLAPVAINAVAAQPENPYGRTYNFAELTSRSHYLAREHLLNYGRSNKDIGQSMLGRLFINLVDGGREGEVPINWGWSASGLPKYAEEPIPLTGIKIVKRESVGLVPYTVPPSTGYGKGGFCAPYAVEVGSMLDYTETIQTAHATGLELITLRIAGLLKAQIAATEQN